MEKYIHQSLKQACEEIEEIQAKEDEQFLDEDDPFGGRRCEHCSAPIEEGHDCMWEYEQEMRFLDAQLGMDE